MTSPVVSVVTPARDVGPWIGEAVDSVLAQTERDFEYIVIDDGSVDDTADQVRRRAAVDDRVRLVDGGGRGSAVARNIGIEQARAPLVAFLDGDDRWHPRFLQRELAVLARAPAAVGATFCHTLVMSATGRVVSARWQPSGTVDLDRMLVENCPPHNGSSLVVCRSCFDEAGLFDPAFPTATDLEMWLRITARSATPLFWGDRRYLLDMRIGRPGSVSLDRSARFADLETILAGYAPRMRRLHPGLAYVRPAVFAYRDGHDDTADRWADQALAAGRADLLRDAWGRALLTWHGAGPTGRACLRRARDAARSGTYRGLELIRGAGR
jgi:glycosyltransferase involved in cell wall biosynthesis